MTPSCMWWAFDVGALAWLKALPGFESPRHQRTCSEALYTKVQCIGWSKKEGRSKVNWAFVQKYLVSTGIVSYGCQST